MANANAPESPYKHIIKDYVGYKLRSRRIFVDGYDNENNFVSETCRTLRRVGDELEEENVELFATMCEQLQITSNTAYPTFQNIADEIFGTDRNWGRIVAFVSFGATLAVHCASRDDMGPQYVERIVNWISRYMEVHLDNWMAAHGSWVSICKVFIIFYGDINKVRIFSAVSTINSF